MCSMSLFYTPLSSRDPVLRFRAFSFERGDRECDSNARRGVRLTADHGGLTGATVQVVGNLSLCFPPFDRG